MRIKVTSVVMLLGLVLAAGAQAGDRRPQAGMSSYRPPVFDQIEGPMTGGRQWGPGPGFIPKSACDRVRSRDVCIASSTCEWFGDHCGACTTGRGCDDSNTDPFPF